MDPTACRSGKPGWIRAAGVYVSDQEGEVGKWSEQVGNFDRERETVRIEGLGSGEGKEVRERK